MELTKKKKIQSKSFFFFSRYLYPTKKKKKKVIKCRGRMIDLESIDPVNAKSIGEHYRHYMIAIAELIQHPIMIDTPLKSDVFVSKHSPDMKFVSVDERLDLIESMFFFNFFFFNLKFGFAVAHNSIQ